MDPFGDQGLPPGYTEESVYKGNIDGLAEYVFSDQLKPDEIIPVAVQEPGKDKPVFIHYADEELKQQFSRALFEKGLYLLWGIESPDQVDYSTVTKDQLDQMNKCLKPLGITAEVYRYWIEAMGTGEHELFKAEVKFSFVTVSGETPSSN